MHSRAIKKSLKSKAHAVAPLRWCFGQRRWFGLRSFSHERRHATRSPLARSATLFDHASNTRNHLRLPVQRRSVTHGLCNRAVYTNGGQDPNAPFAGPSSARTTCPDPIDKLTQAQLKTLDPSGSRMKLFDKRNIDAAKVGDVVLLKQKSGDPFAGVCIDIRRRGIDTAICLRNSLTRVGVEVWFKINSPSVLGIEVIQRKEKRARRARLYYMRKPKHDIGSVAHIVHRHQQERLALSRTSSIKGRDTSGSKRKSNKRR